MFMTNMFKTSVFSTGASLSVKFDNEINTPGEKLSGKVYLEIFKDSISADDLGVRFHGEERTKITRVEDKKTKHYYDDYTFIDIGSTLYKFRNGVVTKGKYEFAFALTIPLGLPGRSGNLSGSDYFAIRYFFSVKLERHGILTFDVKNHHEILLCDSPFDYMKTPTFHRPESFPVTSCFCFSAGSMTLGVNTDTCDILVGDKLVINYVIHNESTQKIKALEVTLLQDISFTADGRSEHQQSTLCNVRLDASELSDGIERVAKECLSSASESISTLSMELISKKNEIVFKIPNSIRPTYNGKLGDVNYSLVAKVCTPFLVEDPQFIIPLRAHCNPNVSKNLLNGVSADEEYAVEIPSDWNPSISADQVNLDRPSKALKSSNSSSVESLKELLSSSTQWNETYIVRDWIWKGNLDELLVDDNLAEVYRFMKSEYSYIVISDYFNTALKGKMTCKLICSAARVPKYKQVESRVGILANFASNCIDKENAKETFQLLDMDNFTLSMILLKYA